MKTEYAEITLSPKEQKIVDCIQETMDAYCDGFSDVMVEDLVAETGFNVHTVKGTLGSLYVKDVIDYMDVNGEYNVYYLHEDYREHIGLDY